MSSSDSRSLTLVGDYLEAAARTTPEMKDQFVELNANVQKKLWYQVAEQLMACLTNPSVSPATLLALQENVVARVYKKLAPLEYARWSIAIAALKTVEEGLKHIESVLPHVQLQTAGQTSIEQDEQAVLLLQLEATRRQLSLGGDIDAIKDRLADSKKAMDRYAGVMDARVYASYYQASYEYSKLKGNPQEYYTNSLLYLTYTPLQSIPLATQAALASDIGLAALLGKNIYNFGELLQHPILKSLDATEYAWLPKLLVTFNQGNIKGFNEIFEQVKGKYPTLAQNASFLNQKLRIMTLMELVFRLPSSKAAVAVGDENKARGRFLTFDAISVGCDLPKDQVEWLVMKALALKVVKGEIDQVAETVRVTWVSPRVLDIDQVKSIKNRLAVWQAEVEQTTVFVENNAAQIM